MAFQPQDISVMFYMMGWKDRIKKKKWDKKKMKEVIREISDISLERPITVVAPDVRIKLKSVPGEDFSGLQLYAGMMELAKELKLPVPESEAGRMAELFSKGTKTRGKKRLKKII